MPAHLFRISLAALLTVGLSAASVAAGNLIPEDLARRNGMVRAWFSQAELNPARNGVENVVLDGDQLVVLTTAGVVHAMDANNGRTLWTTRIGDPNHRCLGPAISANHVAVVNGSTLFVMRRKDGQELLVRQLSGGAGGAPTLSATHAFVPLFSGRVEGYSIEEPKRTPWYYSSGGRIFRPAVASGSSVVWSTDRSRLFVADSRAAGVRYRFDSGAPIVAPAAVRSPLVYAASLSGHVYALHEDTGQQRWRYAAGFAVSDSPVVVGDRVYVATEEPALHAMDAADGQSKWIAEGVSHFIAASKTRVYGIDRVGGLVALNLESGAVEGRAASRGENSAVLNNQTDRLYIYSRDGLIQCFHEIGADEPLQHQVGPAEGGMRKKKSRGDSAGEDEGSAESDPFGVEPGGDPFGREDDDMAGDADLFDGGGDAFDSDADDAEDPFETEGGDGGDDPFNAGDDEGEDPFEDPFN